MHDPALRLFFALPCPPAITRQIDAWRQGRQFAGKQVPSANLHLTLAFLGHLPQSRVALLEQLPPQLPLHELEFDLQLDRLECWRATYLPPPPDPGA
jgi:2'-5' RNA ligase